MKQHYKITHVLFFCIALIPFSVPVRAQSNIIKAEYYIDSDPGFGKATAISVTPGTDISALSFSVDISSLSSGIHSLHSRAEDAKGNWSLNNTALFYKGNPLDAGAQSAAGNLVKFEYFFDTDPGFGKATPVSILGNKTDTSGFAFNVNFAGLSAGKHAFYIRAMDDWGLTTIDSFEVAGALPVTLTSFTAQAVNNGVQLNWQTTSELNNDHFEIGHSTDGIHFSAIGNVKGNGTTAVAHHYEYTDANATPGVNYYRLKQVDIDGNFTLSAVRVVSLLTGSTYRVYPNPAKNKIYIIISSDREQQMMFTLYDITGKSIESKSLECAPGNNNFEWDISRLAKGTYLLRSQNEQLAVIKIVKE